MTRLVLLHGWLGRGADWDGVRGALPPGADAWAPDLPGHGAAAGDEATLDATVDALVARLDAAVVLAGYSMGGRLALHLAVRHPEAVAALVLVSASPGLRTAPERAARRALDAARAAALRADPAAFLDAWYRMPLFASLSDAARRAMTADRRATVDPAGAARALAALGTGAQPSHWDALARIRAPAWAVAGARDPTFVALAHAMAAAGPVTPVVLPEAGHALLAEAPAALVPLLSTALRHV